jgi:iron(III) transport system ATP-binding protein
MPEILQIKNLSHKYDKEVVFQEVSLHLQSQHLLTILGESGCGKTTLLRNIAGLLTPHTGEIHIYNKCVFSDKNSMEVPPSQRGVGLVFQEYALFPALTVSQNIIFGLHNLSNTEKINRLEQLLERMGISEIRHRFPHEISGGQQQRVALARSIAPKPKLLLLDEPFANLDQPRTQQLFLDIREMLQEIDAAAILITHNHQDALTFSDKLAIFEKTPHGAYLAQIDSPQNIYHQPQTESIATMFGQCNVLNAEFSNGFCRTKFGIFQTSSSQNKTRLIIREEDIEILEAKTKSDFRCIRSFFLGKDYRIMCVHISGNKIFGHSKTPIKSEFVNVRFLKKDNVWMI